jgi:hypothetical protein
MRFVPLELARIDALRFEAVVLACFSDERPLRGAAGLCDWRLCGRLSRWIARGRISGERGEVALLPVRDRLPFDKLLLFGLGSREDFSEAAFADVAARMLDALARLRLRTFVVSLPGRSTGTVSPTDAIRWFLTGAYERSDIDEIVVLDEPDAHRVMAPLVEAERRRVRAARQLREG